MLSGEGLIAFLENDLGVDVSDVTGETALFSSQLVDSFALVTLMMFLEKQANIRIAPADVNLDNMDTINRMLAYVDKVKV
jgi:acyl carrier protein